MKTAVIISVLSLTLCLSQAATPPEHPTETATGAKNDKDVKVNNGTVHTEIKETQTPTPSKTTNPAEAKVDKPTEKTQVDTKPEDAKETKPTENKPDDNKTDKKNEATATTKLEPAKIPEKPKNETKPAGKAETPVPQVTSTEKPSDAAKVTETTTEAPKAVEPVQTARGFDGPSFIGGIILTLGLLAIGFMGFKYYKNQTERNYHTL